MKLDFLLLLIIAAAMAFGAVAVEKVREFQGNNRPSKTEIRYVACVERGMDAQSCALEQLMLRGLTCKS